MRAAYSVLLAATAFVACINAVSAATSDLSTVPRSILSDQATAQRFVKVSAESDEERRLTVIEKVASSTTTEAMRAHYAENWFTGLSLHDQKGFLFGVPEMKQWANIVKGLHSNNYQASVVTMLKTMLKHYGEADLARYMQSAKASPTIGSLVKKLQSALFAQWRATGKSTESITTMLEAKLPTANQALAARRDKDLVKTYARYLGRHPLD